VERKVILENFWPPYLGDGDARLFSDEVGWRLFHQTDARSKDTYQIFNFYVGYYMFNLILYYIEDDVFLYFDTINGNVFRLEQREDWDGKYVFERCEFTDYPEKEPDYLFEFNTADELWNDFCYSDRDLRYLIEHSVVDTQH